MSDTPTPSKSNRSYWNAIADASPIRKFWGRLVVVILFTLPVVAIAATTMLSHVIRTLGMLKYEDPTLASSLVHQLQSVGGLFLIVIMALCCLGIYFVFFISVRVYGPQKALVQFIRQIQSGNYGPFRELRKDDQLGETWNALQDLARSLREKN